MLRIHKLKGILSYKRGEVLISELWLASKPGETVTISKFSELTPTDMPMQHVCLLKKAPSHANLVILFDEFVRFTSRRDMKRLVVYCNCFPHCTYIRQYNFDATAMKWVQE